MLHDPTVDGLDELDRFLVEKVADHLTLIEVALGSFFKKVWINYSSPDAPAKDSRIKAAHLFI